MRWVRVGVVAPAGGSSSQPSAANCEVDCTVPSEAPRAHPETLQPQPQPQSHSPLIAAALPVCTTPERAASADAEAMHDDHVLQGTPPSPPLDSQLLLPPGTPPAAQDWSSWFDAATPVDAPSLGDSPLVGTGSPLILYEREQATYVASPLTSAIKVRRRIRAPGPLTLAEAVAVELFLCVLCGASRVTGFAAKLIPTELHERRRLKLDMLPCQCFFQACARSLSFTCALLGVFFGVIAQERVVPRLLRSVAGCDGVLTLDPHLPHNRVRRWRTAFSTPALRRLWCRWPSPSPPSPPRR